LRKLLSIIFLILRFSGYSQGNNGTNLNIYATDCRMLGYPLDSKDTLWIYKTDTLIQRIPLRIGQGVRDPIVIRNLTPGPYRLTFVNTFGQHINKKIDIPDSAEYTYRICPDELAEQRVNTLSRLKTGESIILRFKETSCWVDGNAQIRIIRKKGYFIASLKGHLNGNYITRSIKLTKEMEFDFTRFENELRFIKNGGRCTTKDYYTIESKYGTFVKMDGFCNWDGFSFLKSSLFGQLQ
jgi:hypothetical protein